MRWPAAKKIPLLVKYLGCHCDCDVRRFMLWFNTHEWKRSVNGMRPALTAESAGRGYQQVTLSLLSRPNVFDAARIQMPPQPNFVLAGIE
ncbi:MAG: hypothetical protein WB762_09515 [Candidatus Sulfotelmatobacter sp.]